jgi:PAS domain S-box-containing protein
LTTQLADAERRLHLALDAAGATGGWDWDITKGVLIGDPRFAALMGLDPVALEAGVPTSQFFRGIVSDDQKRVRIAVAGILAGAEVFSKEYRLLRADGGTRWVHAQGRAVLDEADQPVRFSGHLVDITEQKRIQEQLRIAQTAGGIGTFEHADGFGTVLVSSHFCQLLGLHPTRVLPVSTVNGLVHPDDRPIIEPILPEEPIPNKNIEFRITRADTGEPRWLARRGEYVRNLTGPGLSYIGVAYDITASKLIEERLRQANEALSERVKERTEERNRVWQNSRDLLAVLDLEGRIRDVNPAWLEIVGLGETALLGKSLDELATGEAGRTQAPLSTMTEGTVRFETLLQHVDGGPRWISWTTSREGRAIYAYGRNVTFEKEQAAALREAEAQLRQSQKMEAVGQLTGGLAHDFNNMLTGIMGSLDIVRRRIAAERYGDVDRFIEAATLSAQRAAALTQRLLAFSRRQSLDRRAVDIGQLVSDMTELLNRTLGEQVRLIADAGQSWPAITDANQLESAILNLAINARDAMPEGGELHISARNVTLRRGQVAGLDIAGPQDFVAIDVRDTGLGMAADVLDKAFDPFFTTKPIGQGTGLGLSMVYGFAQQSGGAVEIRSGLGEGTTISLYLPRANAVEEAEGSAEAIDVPMGIGEQVMVVEDDASVRMLVTEVLRDLGYAPVEATNADAALARLRAMPQLDLMISDVGLPGMNGRQLAELAREITPELKILFMTGYAATALNRGDFLGPGMDMIIKPFDLEQLGRKIKEMLGSAPL